MMPMDVLGGAMTSDWIDFILTSVVGGTAFLCLFEGTRRIAAFGAHRRSVVLAGLGAAFYLIFGSFAYWQYLEFRAPLIPPAPAMAGGEAPKAAGKPLTPERRETANQSRARRAYVESGLIEAYADRNDEKRPFAPTQADVKRREHVVRLETQRALEAQVSYLEFLFWLVTALVAVFFGMGFAHDKSPGSRPA